MQCSSATSPATSSTKLSCGYLSTECTRNDWWLYSQLDALAYSQLECIREHQVRCELFGQLWSHQLLLCMWGYQYTNSLRSHVPPDFRRTDMTETYNTFSDSPQIRHWTAMTDCKSVMECNDGFAYPSLHSMTDLQIRHGIPRQDENGNMSFRIR